MLKPEVKSLGSVSHQGRKGLAHLCHQERVMEGTMRPHSLPPWDRSDPARSCPDEDAASASQHLAAAPVGIVPGHHGLQVKG